MKTGNASSPPGVLPSTARLALLVAPLAWAACRAPRAEAPPPLTYVGSSTIACFLREAEAAYGKTRFELDCEPESFGGARAVLESRCDLAGFAGRPPAEVLASGVTVTPLGRDAIAVLVHPSNPVRDLTRAELAGIFTGRIGDWSEVGGPALPIHPYVVGPASATRSVFRAAVLGADDYAGCTVVRPDAALVERVGADPGGIGALSLSLLQGRSVSTVRVDGQEVSPTNPDYPITRPLHLLWWPGRSRVAAFIEWLETPAARAVLHRSFASP